MSLNASGGQPPYTYSYAPGATPIPGVRVQTGAPLPSNWTATGGILGLVATPGVYATTIRVTDAAAHTFDQPYQLTVSPVVVTNANSLPNGYLTIPYSFTYTATGGTAPYLWTLSSGSTAAGPVVEHGRHTLWNSHHGRKLLPLCEGYRHSGQQLHLLRCRGGFYLPNHQQRCVAYCHRRHVLQHDAHRGWRHRPLQLECIEPALRHLLQHFHRRHLRNDHFVRLLVSLRLRHRHGQRKDAVALLHAESPGLGNATRSVDLHRSRLFRHRGGHGQPGHPPDRQRRDSTLHLDRRIRVEPARRHQPHHLR